MQIPVAYARKARSVTMADAHVVSYSSNSLGAKANELVLAKDAILPGDRVCIYIRACDSRGREREKYTHRGCIVADA